MRIMVTGVVMLFLAACEQAVPNSGVGFDEYSEFGANQAERDAQLSGIVADPSSTAISDETVVAGSEIPVASSASAPSTPPVPSTAREVHLNNPGISDEQDFSAVSSRESIESDRERLAAQGQAYQVVQPKALPQRSGSKDPSIVEFALATSNAVGQSLYRRSGLAAESRFVRNCAKYTSSDVAQIDFLASGGPERDRKGLDPDGDGFACYWDPAPFRQAVRF